MSNNNNDDNDDSYYNDDTSSNNKYDKYVGDNLQTGGSGAAIDDSLRYIGINQNELEKHITISNDKKAIIINDTNFSNIVNKFLVSIKALKDQVLLKLVESENVTMTKTKEGGEGEVEGISKVADAEKPNDATTFFNIIKDHLNDGGNKFKHKSHKLYFKCYKETLEEINLSTENDDEKARIMEFINKAFLDIGDNHNNNHTIKVSDDKANTVNYFSRDNTTSNNNNKKWNNISSLNNKAKLLYTTGNAQGTFEYNNNLKTDNVSKVQEYITQCDIHQKSYNKKHNELITLFVYLQKNIETDNRVYKHY